MTSQNLNKAITDYYEQLKKDSISIDEFNFWLQSLPEPMRTHFKNESIENCKGVLNLQRFVLELRDLSLEEFLKDRLTEEEFQAYKKV
jgi:hypothetical protein